MCRGLHDYYWHFTWYISFKLTSIVDLTAGYLLGIAYNQIRFILPSERLPVSCLPVKWKKKKKEFANLQFFPSIHSAFESRMSLQSQMCWVRFRDPCLKVDSGLKISLLNQPAYPLKESTRNLYLHRGPLVGLLGSAISCIRVCTSTSLSHQIFLLLWRTQISKRGNQASITFSFILFISPLLVFLCS